MLAVVTARRRWFGNTSSQHTQLYIADLILNKLEAEVCDVRVSCQSTEIVVYLDQKRYEIGPWLQWNVNTNHRRRIDLCRFRWPWVTRNPGFIGHCMLQVEYLNNGASYGQSYYRTLIGNHKQSIKWYHFQWPWVTSDPDFKVATFWYSWVSHLRDKGVIEQ